MKAVQFDWMVVVLNDDLSLMTNTCFFRMQSDDQFIECWAIVDLLDVEFENNHTSDPQNSFTDKVNIWQFKKDTICYVDEGEGVEWSNDMPFCLTEIQLNAINQHLFTMQVEK